MEKKHWEIFINAPRETVWKKMITPETYKEWTSPFSPNSIYEGTWEEGEELKLLDMPLDGSPANGMISVIAEHRPPEFTSIKHIGMIVNGVEDRDSEQVKASMPAFENYTLTEQDGGTLFAVDMDLEDKYQEMMGAMWPKALTKLKEMSEA